MGSSTWARNPDSAIATPLLSLEQAAKCGKGKALGNR